MKSGRNLPIALTAAAALLLAAGLGGVCMAASDHAVENLPERAKLDSGKLVVEFANADGRLALAGLRLAGGTEWAAPAAPEDSLWKIALKGPDGKALELTSAGSRLSGMRCSAEKARFMWAAPEGEPAITVEMTVQLARGSALSCWQLSARLPQGWKAERFDYPLLPNIRRPDGMKLAAPVGWGVEYPMTPGETYHGRYPSCAAGMQFMALYQGGQGIYLGAHDPKGNVKELNASASDRGVSAGLSFIAAPPEEGGGLQEVPYPSAVGLFEGDYMAAARIYRTFSFSTPWGKGGPISKRSIPAWLKDTEVWLRSANDPMRNVDECPRVREALGVPVSIHWYQWHQIPYDTLYPEYFPVKPDFPTAFKALQKDGFHVMPYINGRLCDPESETWKSGGSDWAARQPDGQPYTEIYGSKVPLNAMCPYTAGWQAKINSLIQRLAQEYGVDGVYVDQIGAAAPQICSSASHGHLPGGGTSWVDGYRSLLTEARRKLKPSQILTTEENAECWVDQFDALLVVNTPASARPLIPLFPAVYSGRAISFGFQYIPETESAGSIGFLSKMARCFLWGGQLGWVRAEKLLAPDGADGLKYLRNLAHCRRQAHAYVQEGSFLGMVDVKGGNPRVKGEGAGSFGGSYPIDMPSVMASAWLADDRSMGVCVTNMTGQSRDVEVEIPLQAGGFRATSKLNVRGVGPDGELFSEPLQNATRSLHMEPFGAVLLEVRKGR